MSIILKVICLVLSGGVQEHSKFPCGDLLFWYNTSTHDLHSTMSKRGQYYKSIAAWLHYIITERIQAPGFSPFLARHHLTTLEASTHPTKKSCSSKNCTHFDSLSAYLLQNIYMWHSGLLYFNKRKPFLLRLTKYHPVICYSTSYKLKYVPFGYYM